MTDETRQESGVRLLTFGCRLNTCEAETMRRLAREGGLGDIVIVNTCSVTAEAGRQVRQGIRRAHKENPSARIVVTGCAAELEPEAFAAMPGVFRVIGNARKLDAEAWRADFPGKIATGEPLSGKRRMPVAGGEGRTRAFVQVQDGCNHRCTYCVVPQARGPSRSFDADDVIREVRAAIGDGRREVILTGVDIAAWGADLPEPSTLARLVQRILDDVPGLPRLRLSSLDPSAVDAELIDLLLHEKRLMPHVHLSVQAGDDMVLARMRRRHRREDVIALCKRLRAGREGMAIGADFITGFPTETDAMFENTLRLVDEAGIVFLHVFPYSERPGTPAARMPQVPKPVRRARASRLRALGEVGLARFLEGLAGWETAMVVERGGMGHAENFVSIRPSRSCSVGDIVRVRLGSAEGGIVVGEVLS